MAITNIERVSSGIWNDASAWSSGSLPGAIGYHVNFGVSASGITTVEALPATPAVAGGLTMNNAGATLLVKGLLTMGTGQIGGDTNKFEVNSGHLIVDGGQLSVGTYLSGAKGLVELRNGGNYLWEGNNSTQTVDLGTGFGNNFTFTKAFGGTISGFNSGEMITYSGVTTSISIANNKIHFNTTSGNFTINLSTPGVTYNSNNMTIVGNSVVTTITEAETNQPPDPPPSAATVTSVTSTTANGSYNAGDVIEITVAFSKAVNVTGTPTLTLETGTTDRTISYFSGSGTGTLVFNYTVQPGDTSADLNYLATNALALANGSIKNANGNVNANLTLPAPGAAGSLGANKAIVIDTLAPAAPSGPILAAASDTGTSNNDGITNVTTPVITGTAEAGTTVWLYDGATVLGSAIATGGNWSITATTLAEGPHTLTAKATDAAGNIGAASSGLNVMIDTTKPTLTITSDVASLKIGETAKITFSFTEDPGATFTLVDVVVSGGTLGAISGAGLTREATFTPTNAINGGSANISVPGNFTDKAGNAGLSPTTVSISFDTSAPGAPTLAVSAPSDTGSSDNDGITNVTTPVITGTAEAGATVTLYDGATVLGTAIANGGTWSITTTTLVEGVHTLTAKATDAAGNTGAASTDLSVTIDTTAPAQLPAPTLTSDTGTSTVDGITSSAAITYSAPAPKETLLYSTDDITYGATAPTMAGDGLHTVHVKAQDLAGNISDKSSLTFTLDQTAPSPTVVFGANKLGFGETTIVDITFAETVVQFGLEDLTATGGVLNNFQKIDDSTFKATFNTTTGFVGVGSVNIAATYFDVAGNTGSAQKAGELIIDATAPVIPTPNGPTPNPTDVDSYDGQIPALIVADFVNGGTPATAAKLAELSAFAKMQYGAYLNQGVANPGLGPYEALGRGFAETATFQTKYGALSESVFIQSTYKAVFGKDASAAQQQHFQNQIDYFEGIYEKANLSAAQAESLSKGAVLGQMLGISTLEGPGSHPYLLEATNFLIDASDGVVSYGKPLTFWDVL
jgi:hypothetical protein